METILGLNNVKFEGTRVNKGSGFENSKNDFKLFALWYIRTNTVYKQINVEGRYFTKCT